MAETLSPRLGARIAALDWHRFPDGESLVTLRGDVHGQSVALLCTLRDPDTRALPLRFAAETARELGATRVGLIAPYLGYTRQDHRFHEGEAVSAPLFARFLEQSFDWLVTVDPHLHRIPTLEALFAIPARRAVAAPLLADWIKANVPDPVLLGPDSESQQWVAQVAQLAGCPYEVLRKHRLGDRSVRVSVPDSPALLTGTPVIVDDIASSGRTMVSAIERLAEAGAKPPICAVIHAVFADSAYDDILAAGAHRVVSTDTIPHASNAIGVSGILAKAVKDCMGGLDLPAAERTTLPNSPNATGQ